VSTIPEVLFVCVHNAGRSQMAAALLDYHAAGRVCVRSAGSTPADEINPAVVAVMADVGLDLSAEFPKPLTDDVAAADVVITMGCGDACLIYPGQALPRLGPARPRRPARRAGTADPRRHRPLAARAPQPLGKDARGHHHGSSHRQGEAPSEARRDSAGTNPDMS